jgi:hypothetical protein
MGKPAPPPPNAPPITARMDIAVELGRSVALVILNAQAGRSVLTIQDGAALRYIGHAMLNEAISSLVLRTRNAQPNLALHYLE